MASPTISKLKALMTKNLLEMKRNVASTICELFFPVILMAAFLGIRIALGFDTYEFKKEEKTYDNYLFKRSTSNIHYSDYIEQYKNNKYRENETDWKGLHIFSPFNICTSDNDKEWPRPKIATVKLPPSIREQIVKDLKVFNHSFSSDNFIEFNSYKNFSDYMTNKTYGTDNPEVCFGIVCNFTTSDNDELIFNYSLHYFDNKIMDGAEDLPASLYILDQFQVGPDMDSYEKYQKNGYTYIMKVIADYIVQNVSDNNVSSIDFGMVPMVYDSYRTDSADTFITFIGPFFILIAYMGHLCIYAYKMVLEKETKAKEGMKIMGLTDGIYFMSYFIQYTVIALFDAVINAVIFLKVFKQVPYIVFFSIFFLFSMNVFALAFLFQSFIDKTKETLIISILVYFTMFFLCLLVADESSSYNLKIALSVFPPVTIYNAITLLAKFETHFRPFHSGDIYEKYTNYRIIMMIILLSGDLFLYLFLGYYLQNVLPHDFGIRKPWYFIFKKLFCIKNKKSEYHNQTEETNNLESDDIFGNLPVNDNFQSEEIYKDMTHPKDTFRIRNLVKQFGDGKIAVNHVDLNFYKNEIFALLGHNGAGKTTMISMLTGLYEATSGEAIYDGINVISPENIDSFRRRVGICPQHDVLFMDLNIREHLRMFAIFKEVPPENVEAEVNKSISDFQFEDIQNTVVKNLSAGQRRKLSIAISLIGGSEIIFLDEPSSGMDITSRRNLWEILKRQSDNKIIILTTHYMEEASVLGKRIGIINLGKMKCIGTPLFLIERFGKYMSITLSKEEGADNDTIMSYISQKVERPQFESLSEEIMARIPNDNFKKEGGISLHKFFEELDENLENLKVKSYSVSMPTLEDVFLNVAAEDESQRISQVIREEAKYDDILFAQDYLDNFEYKSKFLWDFKANFIRRVYLMIRDKKGILLEIFFPILLVLIGAIISQVDNYHKTPDFGTEDLPKIGKQLIYFFAENETFDTFQNYTDSLNPPNKDKNLTATKERKCSKGQLSEEPTIVEFFNYTYNIVKPLEMRKGYKKDMHEKDYVGIYSSLLMLNEPKNLVDDGNNNPPYIYEFVELINARVVHGVPLYTSLFLNSLIKHTASKKNITVNINYKNQVMDKTYKQEHGDTQDSQAIVIILVATAFAIIPANFVTIIVRERANNSKHLMKLSGLNIYAYWIVNFIFEIVKYYFTGGICIIILELCDFRTPYLEHLYLLYGPPLILFTYALSFNYDEESNAQNKILLINFLGGILGATTVLNMRTKEDTSDQGKLMEYQLFPLPSFAFSFGYNLVFSRVPIYEVDYKGEWYDFKNKELLKHIDLLLGPMIALGAQTVVYFIALIIIEINNHYKCCSVPTNEILLNEEKNRDEGVVKEEIRALNEGIDSPLMSHTKGSLDQDMLNENLINTDQEGREFMIRIKNLNKLYPVGKMKYYCSCCKNKGTVAIKNLSFCVEKGECFGLLGLNGAGKTTTFKCITQEINQTNGEILINGINTQGNFGLIKSQFGYCPQYDAIFDYLSVKENLEFYAKIKGVKAERISDLVTALISEMRLQEFTNKIAGRLSGGNKRKLTVAISMLCNPPIILLDEPSTGMDPEARRFMWSVIHKMSTKGKKSSIIMTTHSMDEAETLCKRMAIMVNGEFACLGKANEIKNKYGYGYEVNIRIKPMTEEQQNELYYKKYNIDNKVIVREDNFEEILGIIKKENFISELEDGRLGERLLRDMKKNYGINISALLSWIFYVENAVKFIEYGRDNFSKIVIEESMENNFLFKMKKNKSKNVSIGYLFGLFELHKDECFITEYSIDQTSLEQIFNKFAQNQKSMLAERGSTVVEIGDVENVNSGEKVNFIEEKIVLTKLLSGQLLGELED